MATDLVMPRLSDSMEEGTILTWIKSVGDDVAVGDELVEIETDKANMVYESDSAGTLVEIIAGEGDTLPIGEVIARLGEAGEAADSNGAGEQASEDEERIRREVTGTRRGRSAADARPRAEAEAAPVTDPSAGETAEAASPASAGGARQGGRTGQGESAGAADRA